MTFGLYATQSTSIRRLYQLLAHAHVLGHTVGVRALPHPFSLWIEERSTLLPTALSRPVALFFLFADVRSMFDDFTPAGVDYFLLDANNDNNRDGAHAAMRWKLRGRCPPSLRRGGRSTAQWCGASASSPDSWCRSYFMLTCAQW